MAPLKTNLKSNLTGRNKKPKLTFKNLYQTPNEIGRLNFERSERTHQFYVTARLRTVNSLELGTHSERSLGPPRAPSATEEGGFAFARASGAFGFVRRSCSLLVRV